MDLVSVVRAIFSSRRIVADLDPHFVGSIEFDLDFELKPGAVQLPERLLVLEVTVEGVIDELREREPWFVVEVPQHRQDADTRTNVHAPIRGDDSGTRHGERPSPRLSLDWMRRRTADARSGEQESGSRRPRSSR